MNEPTPFVLSCFSCDAGDRIDSEEQALREGWTYVIEDSRGYSWNYLGWCPKCGKQQDELYASR